LFLGRDDRRLHLVAHFYQVLKLCDETLDIQVNRKVESVEAIQAYNLLMDFFVLVLFVLEGFLVLFEIPKKHFLALEIILILEVLLTSEGKLGADNLADLKTAHLGNMRFNLLSQFVDQGADVVDLPDVCETRLLNFSIFVER
jgi:hypothetical protein